MKITIKIALEWKYIISNLFNEAIAFELADPLIDALSEIESKTDTAFKKIQLAEKEKQQLKKHPLIDEKRISEILDYQESIAAEVIEIKEKKIDKKYFPPKTVGKVYMMLKQIAGDSI